MNPGADRTIGSSDPIPGPAPAAVGGRAPGEGRYAWLEREQRFVFSRIPDDARRWSEITDHYVTGTRLRVRRVEVGGEVVLKLCQKVRVLDGDPESVKLTNIYLSLGEFQVLSALPGVGVRKTRWRCSVGAKVIAVDQFHDRHRGLILAEVELAEHEPRISPPPESVADVTNDDRFSGGALALASDLEMQNLLNQLR